MLIMSVIMVASKSVTAQSIETMGGPNVPDQLAVGGHPEDIAVNQVTNKIYILNPLDAIVTVLDSKSGTVKNIPVGSGSVCFRNCITVDQLNNKIYVANTFSDTVSVIDGNSDTVKKNIPVGDRPTFILVSRYQGVGLGKVGLLPPEYKIYVANTFSNTVSVIDGSSDTVKKNITVGLNPSFILDALSYYYVACYDAVYVINPSDDTVKKNITLPGLGHLAATAFPSSPMYMDLDHDELYVLWGQKAPVLGVPGPVRDVDAAYRIELPKNDPTNGTVKQIPFTSALQHVFPGLESPPHYLLGEDYLPGMVQDVHLGKKYILNRALYNGTVSVDCTGGLFLGGYQWYHKYCSSYQKHIVVGQDPGPIAINDMTFIVYVGYPRSGTISAINGLTDSVAVGVIFNVNPSDAGVIKCNNTKYPTNTYIYVDSGTNCTAQNGKGFEFNTWTESPLTNRNSSTPIEQSSDHPETITIDRFGIFTANFKLPHHLTTEELLSWLAVAISAAVAVNGVILLLPGWRRAKEQRTHLRECIKMIDDDSNKSHKDGIEDKIIGYYVDGKLK